MKTPQRPNYLARYIGSVVYGFCLLMLFPWTSAAWCHGTYPWAAIITISLLWGPIAAGMVRLVVWVAEER